MNDPGDILTQVDRVFGDNGHKQEGNILRAQADDKWLTEALTRRVPEGSRHQHVLRMAGWFRNQASVDAALLALRAWNTVQGDVALADGELVATVQDVYARYAADGPEKQREQRVQRRVIRLAEALRLGPPPRDPLIEEMGLYRAKYVGVTGEEASGKTGIGHSLAVAVATGREAFGAFTIDAPGPVLLSDQENDPADTLERLAAIVRGIGEDPVNVPIDLLDRCTWEGPRLNLASADDQADLLRIVEEKRPVLLLLDSLRRHHTADENSSTAMEKVNSYLLNLAHTYKLTIWAVQQLGKPSEGRTLSHRTRGTSDLMAAFEATYPITRAGLGDIVTVSNKKNRKGERDSFSLRMSFGDGVERWEYIDEDVRKGSAKTATTLNNIVEYLNGITDPWVRRATLATGLDLDRHDGTLARALKKGVAEKVLTTDNKGAYALSQQPARDLND